MEVNRDVTLKFVVENHHESKVQASAATSACFPT
jgi:hypothetical protein